MFELDLLQLTLDLSFSYLISDQKAGGDDEDDPMINPAHALIGTAGANRNVAHRFADWLAQPDGGQQVVAEFAVGGVRLYSRAPAVKMNV